MGGEDDLAIGLDQAFHNCPEPLSIRQVLLPMQSQD
jgi:hypothetical protein